MEVVSDRRYRFDAAPPELWAAATTVGAYRDWWPWLRRFDGVAFAVGEVWSCEVQPPLPYVVRFTIELEEVDPPLRVRTTIAGDIVGSAELEIAAAQPGSQARLVSRLAPASPLLRMAAQVVRPVVRFGHDWVLDTGARQFSDILVPSGSRER